MAGPDGLFRADELPRTDGDWKRVFAGDVLFPQPLRPLEREGDCHEAVEEDEGRWCWSRRCPGDPTTEGVVCFAKEGELEGIEAHSIAETSDVLRLTVEPPGEPAE
jgi:hypothetical protein